MTNTRKQNKKRFPLSIESTYKILLLVSLIAIATLRIFNNEQKNMITALQSEVDVYSIEISSLEERINILTDKIGEQELSICKLSNDYPVSSTMTEYTEGTLPVGKYDKYSYDDAITYDEGTITYHNRWNITLSDYELNLLARIVMLEAGGESLEGKEAVIEVIFNRMIDDYFHGTLEEVLSSGGQFATWANISSTSADPTNECYVAIYHTLVGNTNLLPFEVVYFARQAENDKVYTVIGNHWFCTK